MSELYSHVMHVSVSDAKKLAELKAYLTEGDEQEDVESDDLNEIRDELNFDEIVVEQLSEELHLSIAFESYDGETLDCIEAILEHWNAKLFAHHCSWNVDSELIYEESGKRKVLEGKKADSVATEKFGMDL